MFQQGQVFELKSNSGGRWAYPYRVGGRGSRHVQRGGYESEQAATQALERALERLSPRTWPDSSARAPGPDGAGEYLPALGS